MNSLVSKLILMITLLSISACSVVQDIKGIVVHDVKEVKKNELKVDKDNGIIDIEFYLIKLYTKENLDSSKIIDSLNSDLRKDIDISKSLDKYGNTFLETKLILKTVENKSVDFGAVNTYAYVSDIKDSKLIIDYYKTGVSGNLKVSKLDNEKYIMDYSIEISNLLKLDQNSKNKISYVPYVNKKEFYQNVIINKNSIQAFAINNTDAKQYDIVIFGLKWMVN